LNCRFQTHLHRHKKDSTMHVMRILWEESVNWDLDTEKTLGIVCNICVSLVSKELSNNPCVLLGTYGLGFRV
jgi:hypothetical protein